ncbi:MAG: hypothetical protein Fur0041_00340 [Bacteroidia bacterium]
MFKEHMSRYTSEREKGVINKAAKTHPLINLMFFLIIGIGMLFFTMMVLFAISAPERHLGGQHFPKWFFLSTVIILASSYTIERARRGFDLDNGEQMLNHLMMTGVLAVAFSITQFLGWKQLWTADVTLFSVGSDPVKHTSSGAFLYVISGLHLIHLVAGIIFLFMAMFRVVNMKSDAVKAVLFYSDPQEKAKITALARYWHFLDFLWVVLFLYFLWFFVG